MQYQGGSYYPAGIYLGGAAQTVVRAIDSDVLNLFTRAEASANGGGNSTGGGATGTNAAQTTETTTRGYVSASLSGTTGGGWQVKNVDATNSYRSSGATVSLAAGNCVVSFKNVPGYVTPADVPVTVTANLLAPVTATYGQTFASWGTLNLAGVPAASATALADADGDGTSNLLEFAFGTDPRSAGSDPIAISGTFLYQRGLPTPWVGTAANGADYRALFGRRKNWQAAGLTYTVQFSADLVTWQNSTATPAVLAPDGDDEIEAVTVPYPYFINGRKARFFRVQVSAP